MQPLPPLQLPPTLAVSTADIVKMGIFTKLSYLLAEWAIAGSSAPFAYEELQALAATPDIVQGLIGATREVCYPGGPPWAAGVVPRQVAHYTLSAFSWPPRHQPTRNER